MFVHSFIQSINWSCTCSVIHVVAVYSSNLIIVSVVVVVILLLLLVPIITAFVVLAVLFIIIKLCVCSLLLHDKLTYIHKYDSRHCTRSSSDCALDASDHQKCRSKETGTKSNAVHIGSLYRNHLTSRKTEIICVLLRIKEKLINEKKLVIR